LFKWKTTYRNEFNTSIPDQLSFDRKGYNAPLTHVLAWLRSEQFRRIIEKAGNIVVVNDKEKGTEQPSGSCYNEMRDDDEDSESTRDSVDSNQWVKPSKSFRRRKL